ncbi:hypothetical protein A2738_00685 [Candidatus Nomurabacteria bacterium RIFCSPHIGHO2_01_FULL_42_15]|uniref:Uncharacterized protein n=1 Tax=Candidatus Nomurabacteria bacterium RIFCSPHIGHO2_01_FULL_42_15 TaxID=1801742 RepID=A0A1F6VFI8_9BACT|nr:MAG: hypothetical protein A2738_00685 [Candidatus Nomurabacteria bacterium RIFCSPHIGHO2_01_FULL_42_15]OGI93186.1 MAG: hypothetical protein A3A99_01485 [Candidatus Nomurabacteria bacterium RIFCSPLOWO2_01_FULL_41_18]
MNPDHFWKQNKDPIPTPAKTIEELEKELYEKRKALMKLYEDGKVENDEVGMEEADLRIQIEKLDRALLQEIKRAQNEAESYGN